MHPQRPCLKPQNNKIQKRSNMTVKTNEFSNENCNSDQVEKFLKEEEFYNLSFYCRTFKNGSCLENKGYVAIKIAAEFRLKEYFFNYDSYLLVCFVSAVDNIGNKRFTRTFSLEYDANSHQELFHPVIFINKYISRQTLLKDSQELLPNDTLTIDVDVYFVLESSGESKHKQLSELNDLIKSSFVLEYSLGLPLKFKLFLDSAVSETLREVSTVFQEMFAYTEEDPSEVLEIDHYDAIRLIKIFEIIKGVDYKITTITDIFELMRVADKYDIPDILETCRDFVKGFLGSKKLPSYLRKNRDFHNILMMLARNCKSTSVIELVEEFVDGNDQTFEGKSWENETKENVSGLKWTYDPSLGFKLTKHSNDFKEDFDYSYIN